MLGASCAVELSWGVGWESLTCKLLLAAVREAVSASNPVWAGGATTLDDGVSAAGRAGAAEPSSDVLGVTGAVLGDATGLVVGCRRTGSDLTVGLITDGVSVNEAGGPTSVGKVYHHLKPVAFRDAAGAAYLTLS